MEKTVFLCDGCGVVEYIEGIATGKVGIALHHDEEGDVIEELFDLDADHVEWFCPECGSNSVHPCRTMNV